MTGVASERLERLSRVMAEAGVDAFFACRPISMGYLMGFWEDGHERLLIVAVKPDGTARLICPALTATQAKRVGFEDIRPWSDGEDPLTHVQQLAEDWNLKSAIIAVDNEMPAHILLSLQETLPAALFKPGSPILSQLMRIKDKAEIEKMQRAADIADEAYEEVKPKIKAGQTENEVSQLLSDAMKRRGGKPTFSIVAAGPNGAEPHHLNDETVLKPGDVVILDFGCDYQGYQSDITRTVAIQHASDKAREVYETVFKAHMAARDKAKASATSGEVDQAARGVIEDAGYGEFFFHRTGHGIGMQGHEEPNISPKNPHVLETGNCFSIEPGIYLAGEFGVRIENIAMAEEGGSYSFNKNPSPTLEIVG